MKKLCTFLIALLLVISSLAIGTEQSEAASFRTVKVVNGSSLVVKASASPSAKTVGTLSKGNFVTVFSTSNGWASIQSGNVRGHVDASFLATPPSTIKIASSKSGLVVKATPSKSAPTSAGLKYNMIVEEFGTSSNGWSFVQYGNVTGYVVSSFISKPKTTTKYVNTASGVVVRNIASPSGTNTGTLANKTQVTVHSTLAGWSYVTAGSTKGYVVDASLSSTTKTTTKAKSNNNTTTKPKPNNNTTPIVQEPQGTGSLKGTVTWQYNDFVGTKADVGAKVYVIPSDFNASNFTTSEMSLLSMIGSIPKQSNIHFTKVNGFGGYEISDIPTGKYLLIISSKNTTRNFDEEVYVKEIVEPLIGSKNYEQFELFNLTMANHELQYIEIKKDKTIDFSNDFGNTYF